MTRKWKVLTAEEERELGRRIVEAEARARAAVAPLDFVQELLNKKGKGSERTRAGKVERVRQAIELVVARSKQDPSLRSVVREAKAAWAEAEAVRWELALSGRRVVYREAKKLSASNLDLADLIQEGHIGLLRAAQRFDPDRDIRFGTYARWWVRAQMTRSIDQHGRTVRLPGGAIEALRNMRKAIKAFEEAGVDYTIRELASLARIDEERAEFLLSRRQALSLEEPIDDGGDPRAVGDVLADESADDPEEAAELSDELGRMHEALHSMLDKRQQFVVSRRFGLEDGNPRSLSELSRTMRLSRERVRQIERRALQTLRESGRIRESALM